MRKTVLIVVVLAVAGGVVFATTGETPAGAVTEPDPIMDAIHHAQQDGRSYQASGWGALAFGASIVFSPLFGGGGVILAANLIEPRVDVPPARMATAHREYGRGTDLHLYQQQYQETMAEPIKRDRSRRAWIGTGIGFGVNVALWTLLLLASY